MSSKLLKLFLVLLVFGAVWLAVVIYWQTSNSDPSGIAIVLWLFALPCALIVGFLATKKGVQLAKKRAAKRTEEKDAGSGDTEDNAGDVKNDPENLYTLSILDTAIRLPLGADPAEALAQLAEGSTRPGLDDVLIDDQGFPVFAARVPELTDDGLFEELALPEQQDETPLAWSPEQLRAVSLAAQALDQICGGVLAQVLALSTAQSSASSDSAEPAEIPLLKLALCLPTQWPQAVRMAARHWLQQRIEAIDWPSDRIVSEILDSHADTRVLTYIDQLNIEFNRQQIPSYCLILACDSAIGEASIARWDSEGKLFNQANPQGFIPAEGAAAVLLATESLSQALMPDPWVRLHRVALAQRDKPADAKGRISGELVNKLASHAVNCAPHAAEQTCGILTDAGLQPGQAIEIGVLTAGDFEHLDTTSQCLNLSAACGYLGAVATLAALALAQTQAGEEEQPVLVLGLQHSLERAALVLQPDFEDPGENAQDENQEQPPAKDAGNDSQTTANA